MTEKQKKAFLKSEGWYPRIHPITGAKRSKGWMVDPHTWDSWGWGLVNEAFAVASRRKRQREARKLKAAGFLFFRFVGGSYYRIPGQSNFYSRQEALQTLEARP